MKICPKCNQDHKKSGIYCSRKCANSRKFSAESRLKTSTTIKKLIKDGEFTPSPKPVNRISEFPFTRLYGTYQCHHCDNIFWRLRNDQKCCSIECRDNIRSQNKCRKTHIKYFSNFDAKEVDLQSTWELKVAQWLDNNNIRWSRPSKRISWFSQSLQKNKTYLPDFYVVDHDYFIDVKNPIKMEQDKIKLNELRSIIPLFVGNIDDTITFVERLAGLEPA
jgi:hypothetical protein